MIFEKGNIYHIYNQGNNRQMIFFEEENYFMFLRKMRDYIIPYADIIAWCLMPNHFHIMVYVNSVEIIQKSDSLSQRETICKEVKSDSLSQRETICKDKLRTFNNSIGFLIRSYTQAINKQKNRTGSLFKAHTKAECVTKIEGITPTFFGSQINVRIPEKEYPIVCWNYIHNNPVTARIVDKAEDYKYSSYRDYIGLRDGKLINKNRAKEFGLEI
jgi:putative transposase